MAEKGKEANIVFSALLCLAFAVVGIGVFLYSNSRVQLNPDIPAIGETANADKKNAGTGLVRWYKNDVPEFSFRIPDGFLTPSEELPNGGSEVVVTKDTNGSDAVLIVALRLAPGSSSELSESIIKAQNGTDSVSDVTPAALSEGTQGLAFRTNSTNWDGDGIAFWFVHGGYVYELSTASKNQPLLESIMQTLTFSSARKP